MRNIILVLGYGKSTKSAIDLLKTQYDADIYVFDEAMSAEIVKAPEITHIQTIDEVPMSQVLFCLKSPGIAYTKPYVEKIAKAGIDILTDVELFLSDTKGKVIAITGTNGKTTVTTLVGDVLKQQYSDVRVCGNIGIPIAEVCTDSTPDTLFVVELSSFQLKGTKNFKPDIAIVLNIADAHLDYHQTEADYVQSKAQIFARQDENDILIYNIDDQVVSSMVTQSKARKIGVGLSEKAEVLLSVQKIVFDNHVFNRENINVPGLHNCYNVAYAYAIGILHNISDENIVKAVGQFHGVKHRLQFVEKIDGISIYNDSKSTNESAVITALKAFDGPTVWICGGYDRKIPYTHIRQVDVQNVKYMIIYGQMRHVFEAIAKQHNIEYTVVDAFSDILSEAMKHTVANGVVLFSPGAASYDLFQNFEQRGDAFLQLVNEYK